VQHSNALWILDFGEHVKHRPAEHRVVVGQLEPSPGDVGDAARVLAEQADHMRILTEAFLPRQVHRPDPLREQPAGRVFDRKSGRLRDLKRIPFAHHFPLADLDERAQRQAVRVAALVQSERSDQGFLKQLPVAHQAAHEQARAISDRKHRRLASDC
jgi:hypothetical protein